MKRTFLLTISLFARLFLVAQTQYDYMDDDAVAGGADRVLNWILVITGLIILGIIIMIFIGFALKIYYWFNPQADPDYVKEKHIKEEEREKKKKEETIIAQKRKDAVVEAIDLGLSVKWASFNLGAYKSSDIGEKFCWTNNLSKAYKLDGKINVNALGDISGIPEYDVATKRLGNKWRMPTDKECRELIDLCSWETKIIDNIEGRLVTGPSGRSIFLPLNQMDYITRNLITGHYWSSCPSFSNFEESAQDLRFGEGCKKPAEFWHAGIGSLFCVRPVYNENHKSKEEKEAEILNEFSRLDTYEHTELSLQYKNYEEQCVIQNNEIINSTLSNRDNIITDKYGVVYSLDGKRLLYGGDCNCESYEIKEGTEFICANAFNIALYPYFSNGVKKRGLKKIILPSSLLYLTGSSICDNCEVESRNKYYTVINNLIIDNRKKSIVKCLNKYVNEVIIGEPIEEICTRAFANCKALKKITLPKSLKVIRNSAFFNNEMLEEINMPNSIEIIEDKAFFYCKCLKITKLPLSLRYLGSSVFINSNIDGIVIPENISFIGDAPFPPKDTNIQSQSKRFVIKDSLLIDSQEGAIIQLINSSIANITIPQNIKKISSNAFNFSNIESIKIPSNIREIGSSVFVGCKRLVKISFEGNLSCISVNTFAGCESLISICIPHGVKVIETAAFSGCKNLTDINLNNGLKVISNNTFIDCLNLKSLKIPESVEILGNNYCSCFRNCPNLSELHYDAKNAIVYGLPGSITKLTIGEHVEVLPRYMVPCDSNIETLLIPENVRKISKECIMGGSNLKKITILSKDIVLEEGWLKNCNNLRKILICADMFETLLPLLPHKKNIKIEKIYSHHFLFFKW